MGGLGGLGITNGEYNRVEHHKVGGNGGVIWRRRPILILRQMMKQW